MAQGTPAGSYQPSGGGLDLGGLLKMLSAGGLGPAALLSFAPALLGKLGLFGKDPMKLLQEQLLKLQSPENIGKLTTQNYQQNLASPAYAQAQGNIAAGANQAGNALSSSLAARGIGTSGIGAILPAVQGSMAGHQLGQLRTSAYDSASQNAQQQLQQQIQTLLGTSGPSQNRQMAGAGINSFAPFLQEFLKSKFPAFGNMGAQP